MALLKWDFSKNRVPLFCVHAKKQNFKRDFPKFKETRLTYYGPQHLGKNNKKNIQNKSQKIVSIENFELWVLITLNCPLITPLENV